MIRNRCWNTHPPIGLRNKVNTLTPIIPKCLHSFFSTTTTPPDTQPPLRVSKNHPTHMIFGANTDVGKTVISTSLIRASIDSNNSTPVHYIKPLGCGESSDADFVNRHINDSNSNAQQQQQQQQQQQRRSSLLECHSLFQWKTPASPHIASRTEHIPRSDKEVLTTLHNTLAELQSREKEPHNRIFVELAGGVVSPSSASPHNNHARHAHGGTTNTNQVNPSWGWSTQADLYQPLRLPVLLVGDGKLGGISTTISSLESLIIRGYDVHGIVLLEDPDADGVDAYGNNVDALREYASRMFQLRSGGGRALFQDPESTIVSLPALPPEPEPLMDWYTSDVVVDRVGRLNEMLTMAWEEDMDVLQNLGERGTDVLWWPFTQHKDVASTTTATTTDDDKPNTKKLNATLIDAASGDNFSILQPANTTTTNNNNNDLERLTKFDACASWWTQGLGHGESSLALAAAAAAGRYGHVIFPNVVHEPATALADRLVHSPTGPGHGWASRVFFSDDGSTAMEVAIKMGMRKYCHDRGMTGDNADGVVLTVCAQKDCYHGDTLGVMDVAEPSVFNEGQHPWYEPKGLFLAYPTVRYKDGVLGLTFPEGESSSLLPAQSFDSVEQALDVDVRLGSELYSVYVEGIRKDWDSYEDSGNRSRLIASVVIEPILLGAGGMKFVDPLWQRALMDVARSKSVPVIFDEIAAGLYRLGVASCREILKSDPDIASYAKLLTGGLLPMSVTLASDDVFSTFLGDSKAEALLHGHSYTAHPVGCVSGLHALDTFDKMLETRGNTTNDDTIPYFNTLDVIELSKLPLVQESMSLGTVLAVTIEPDGSGGGYAAASRSTPIVEYLFENGVYARPLGNVVYIMVSPLTNSVECARLCRILHEAIESVSE